MFTDLSYSDVEKAARIFVEAAEKSAREVDRDRFFSVQPLSFDGRVAAVDGGSGVVVDFNSFLVGILRVGHVLVGDGLMEEDVSPPEMVFLSRENMLDVYRDEAGLIGPGDGTGSHLPPDPQSVLSRMRFFREIKTALGAMDRLGEGDLLLVDGSLRTDIPHPREALSLLVERARERGINLVGVSKTTSLHINGISLLQVVGMAGFDAGMERWAYEVDVEDSHQFGRVFIVRLHPNAVSPFRVDVVGDVDMVLGVIAGLSEDSSLLGYPYPLAMVHNRVAVKKDLCDTARMVFESVLPTISGGDRWMRVFTDFHRILDMGV